MNNKGIWKTLMCLESKYELLNNPQVKNKSKRKWESVSNNENKNTMHQHCSAAMWCPQGNWQCWSSKRIKVSSNDLNSHWKELETEEKMKFHSRRKKGVNRIGKKFLFLQKAKQIYIYITSENKRCCFERQYLQIFNWSDGVGMTYQHQGCGR